MEKIQGLFIKKSKNLEKNTCTKVKETEIVQPQKVWGYHLISIQVCMKSSFTENSGQLFSISNEGRIKGNRQIEAQGFQLNKWFPVWVMSILTATVYLCTPFLPRPLWERQIFIYIRKTTIYMLSVLCASKRGILQPNISILINPSWVTHH